MDNRRNGMRIIIEVQGGMVWGVYAKAPEEPNDHEYHVSILDRDDSEFPDEELAREEKRLEKEIENMMVVY
jgi:hypothetical protein